MKVRIQVFYEYHGIKAMQKGVFPVNVRDYRQSPDHAAAHSAIVFVQVIKRVFPEMRVRSVLYGNDERDITKLVESIYKN